MDEQGISLAGLEADSDRLAEEGKTPMYVAVDGALAGIIAVADVVKQRPAGPRSTPCTKWASKWP